MESKFPFYVSSSRCRRGKTNKWNKSQHQSSSAIIPVPQHGSSHLPQTYLLVCRAHAGGWSWGPLSSPRTTLLTATGYDKMHQSISERVQGELQTSREAGDSGWGWSCDKQEGVLGEPLSTAHEQKPSGIPNVLVTDTQGSSRSWVFSFAIINGELVCF